MTSPAVDSAATEAPSQNPSIQDAAQAASSIAGNGRAGLELSSGVVLRFKPVPPIAIREAALQLRPPQVPKVFMTDRGREEENPNDPDYLKAVEQHALNQLYRVADVLLLLGTEVVELKDGVIPAESEEWLSPLRALRLIQDDDPGAPGYLNIQDQYARYLAWLRYYAVPTEVEIAYCMGRIVSLSGVTELEVQRAAAAFRHRP